jgi:hypothetical protein
LYTEATFLPQGPKSPWSYPALALLSEGYSGLLGRLPTCYSPVRRFTRPLAETFSLDLHVLGTPPAFVLSQDQTLQLSLEERRSKTPSLNLGSRPSRLRTGSTVRKLACRIARRLLKETACFRTPISSQACYSDFKERLRLLSVGAGGFLANLASAVKSLSCHLSLPVSSDEHVG